MSEDKKEIVRSVFTAGPSRLIHDFERDVWSPRVSPDSSEELALAEAELWMINYDKEIDR